MATTKATLDIPAPRPWRIEGEAIRDREGGVVVSAINPASMATRRLIVEAVNGIKEASLEAARLRDIVRRLVTDWEPFINDGPLSYSDERQRAATIREAKAALESKEAQA